MGCSMVADDPYGRFDFSGGYEVEPEAWAYAVCPVSGVAFDVGAHVGNYTFKFSRMVGDGGRVYGFEPGDYAFRVLSRNMGLYGWDNVSVYQYAVSDYDGVGLLFSGRDGTTETHNNFLMRSCVFEPFGDLSMDEIYERGLYVGHRMDSVRVVKLDTFVEEQGLDRLDLVKVDVEGAELKVLKGAWESLKRFSPLLYVEVHYGQDVVGLVAELGYVVKAFVENVRGSTNPIVVLERI